MKAVFALAAIPTIAAADPRSITLEATSEAQQVDAERGVRLELDLAGIAGWSLGVAGSMARDTVGVYQDGMTGGGGELEVRDLEALGYVARTARFAHWSLRGGVYLGALDTRGRGTKQHVDMTSEVSGGGVTPVFEAGLRATVPISPAWAVTGGPLVTYMNQWFTFVEGTHEGGTHRDAELLFTLGLTYQL